MLPRFLRGSGDSLSEREKALIQECARLACVYKAFVANVRLLAWCAVWTRFVPLIGYIALRLLDGEVEGMDAAWDALVRYAWSVDVEITGDDFGDWVLRDTRNDVETEWPAPRMIKLPSDVEPLNG